MKALFLCGLPDNHKVSASVSEQGNIEFVLTGSANVAPFLDKEMPNNIFRLCLSGGNLAQNYSLDFWPDVIFNEISDADSHQGALQKASLFCKQQSKPVINHPDAMLDTQRHRVWEKLKDIPGVTIPKTIRITPKCPGDIKMSLAEHGINYPVLFRKAGVHNGYSTACIESEQQLESAMYAYALDGTPYYLTEFVDFQSADGGYRKYRILVVDGQPMLRSLITGDHWLVGVPSRKFMDAHQHLKEEERELLSTFETNLLPKIKTPLAKITDAMKLDYFGIDCHIAPDNTLLIFEVNPNMNNFINPEPHSDRWTAVVETMQRRLITMLKARGKA